MAKHDQARIVLHADAGPWLAAGHVSAARRASRGCRGCGAGNRGDARCGIRARARARGEVWRGYMGHTRPKKSDPEVEEKVVSGDNC